MSESQDQSGHLSQLLAATGDVRAIEVYLIERFGESARRPLPGEPEVDIAEVLPDSLAWLELVVLVEAAGGALNTHALEGIYNTLDLYALVEAALDNG